MYRGQKVYNIQKLNMTDLIRKFDCPICLDIYKKPIYMCPTGHSLCANCKRKIQKCPSCTKAILETRNFALEDVMGLMQAPCKNKPCPEFLPLDLYSEHLSECQYRQIQCKFQTCCWKGMKNLVDEHIQKVHGTFIVRKDTKLQHHQLNQCFIEHDKKWIYISRHSQKNFVTWSGEGTTFAKGNKAVLAVKISKSNEETCALMSQPICEYNEGNSNIAKESSIVWVLLNKLMDCNIYISIV